MTKTAAPGRKAKRKRVLAVCNTPFQLICVLWLRYSFYADAKFDVIVTDQINGFEAVAQQTEAAHAFDTVTLVRDNDYSYWRGKKNRRAKTSGDRLRELLTRNTRRRSLYKGKTRYDEFLLFNHSRFSLLLYDRLWRRNRNIEVSIYEEGIGCYSHISRCYYDPKYAKENRGKVEKRIETLFRRALITDNIKRMYVFIPSLLKFHPPIEIVRIPPLDVHHEALKTALSVIFDCKDDPAEIPQDVILFEESYQADGWPFDYQPVLEALDKAFGKENVVVKKHPRSKSDIFTKDGFAIFPNSAMPWEVLLMRNPSLVNKTWVSYCSGSMLCAYFYLDLPVHAVSLIDAVKQPLGEIQQSYFRNIRDNLFSLAPQHYAVPATVEEISRTNPHAGEQQGQDLLEKQETAPKLSIVLCVYNGAHIMRPAIQSVLEQEFDDYELICVDDGSTDKTLNVFKEYAALNPHVVVVPQEKNTGLFRARCNGINHAKGDYILFLDADDTYAPGSLTEISDKAHFYHPDVFHYSVKVISEDPKQTKHIKATERFHAAPKGAQNAEKLLRTTFFKNWISRSMWSKAFRREMMQEAIADVDDTRVDYGDDAYLIFRAFYYAQSFYGDPSGRQYYVYRYSPDLYITDKMTTDKFRFSAVSWGNVQQKCREFLEKRGAFDTFKDEWTALSENIMLNPLIHFLMFRVNDSQRGECFALLTEYWDPSILLSRVKKLYDTEKNARVQAQRTFGYRIETKMKKAANLVFSKLKLVKKLKRKPAGKK